MKQLSADVQMLEHHKIIDYSVLLGIHFKDRDVTEPNGAAGRMEVVTGE